MKLNRAPLILLIVAALLGGVVYLKEQTAQPPSTSEAQSLFGFQEGDVRSLSLKTSERSLSFIKNTAPSPAIWQMTSPNNAPANDASVAYLLNSANEPKAFI